MFVRYVISFYGGTVYTSDGTLHSLDFFWTVVLYTSDSVHLWFSFGPLTCMLLVTVDIKSKRLFVFAFFPLYNNSRNSL